MSLAIAYLNRIVVASDPAAFWDDKKVSHNLNATLGGGFKYCLFSLFGEMIPDGLNQG